MVCGQQKIILPVDQRESLGQQGERGKCPFKETERREESREV
jgi:hypothetical protein